MRIETRHELHAPPESVRQWMERPGALVRLTPPGLGGPENPDDGGARAGRLVPVRLGPAVLPDALRPRWLLRHAEDARSGDGGEELRFVDRQVRGPWRTWHHEHAVEAAEAGTTMADRLEIELPRGLSSLETLEIGRAHV